MVGRRRAESLEPGAPGLERANEAGGVVDGAAAHGCQALELVAPVGGMQLQHRIGAECRADAPLAARTERLVVRQCIVRRIGGAERLDVEPLEQRPWAERRLGQPAGDLVVDPLGRRRIQPLGHAEDVVQLGIEPQPGRRAAEQVIPVGEALPDAAVILLDRRAIAAGDAQRLERHALAVEHAEDVVIRNDQQVGGRAEGRLRIGEQCRIDVPMRADQRQVAHGGIEGAGDAAPCRIRMKSAIGCGAPGHDGPPGDVSTIAAGWSPGAPDSISMARTHESRSLPDASRAKR